MCCASLLETVTEKNWPKLTPRCVNNAYFLYPAHAAIAGMPRRLGCHGYREIANRARIGQHGVRKLLFDVVREG